jgi:RNA polymerase sigma-70 factor (ECF subfamily)
LYRAEASLFTWLCQICRHEMHDYLEAQQRDARRLVSIDDDPTVRAALESIPADMHSDPEGLASRTDSLRLVQVVLDYLPANYGNALEWKYVEGLRVSEIASRLQLTPLAAESLLARARRAFRDAWVSVTGNELPEGLTRESTA